MGERPDFMISFGDVSRGLEVTAATTQIFQRSLTLSEKSDAECEIIDEDGWAGDAPEREWSEAVGMAIAAKVKLISSYRPAGHHDILVYSNHPSDVVRRVNGQHSGHDKLRALAALCAPCWTQEPRLGTISVLDGSILLFDLIGRAEPWPILDLRSGFSKRVNE